MKILLVALVVNVVELLDVSADNFGKIVPPLLRVPLGCHNHQHSILIHQLLVEL